MSENNKSERSQISREQFNDAVGEWLEYARENLTDYRLSSSGANYERIYRNVLDSGYTDVQAVEENRKMIRKAAEKAVLEEQQELMDLNSRRLRTLSKLSGRDKVSDLKGTTVVSIGGGPGDGICEPWFPRLASVSGANVVNFDYSKPHPIDHRMGLYTHIGESRGNIFSLLANEKTLNRELSKEDKVSIIECNNLLGNNVSPALGIELQDVIHPENHPKIVEMRNNLRSMAADLLIEGGALAIDDIYYKKKDGELVSVKADGSPRLEPAFEEEK